jgi:hypothetical protein
MRRVLVLFSVPILAAFAIVTAGSASADTTDGGTLTNGLTVTGTVSVPNRDIQYDFSGTDGVHETLDVTASNWGDGTAQLGVYLPNGEAALYCPIDSGASFCDFTPHVTGTWKVKVLPLDDSTGSVTFKLAADQSLGVLAPGTPTTATITTKGQRANFTFPGTQGVLNVIDVPATNWGDGSANLNIYQPDGLRVVICPIDSAPTTCDFRPPVTGTWKAEIAPDDDSLGSATLTLGADPARGTLTPGTPVTTRIATRATKASYTFAATQGVHTVIDVSATNWGDGGANLNIYQPDGVNAVICPIDSPTVCDFTPPVTGTWKAEIAPEDNAVGSATMTLAADQNNGLLTPGVAATTTIATRGQSAYYTFPATKGDKKRINVSATNWGVGGSANLNIYQPDGILGVICPMASARTTCAFTPPFTGTWKAQITPVDNAVGSATLTLVADQDRGTLTPGTAVTTVIPIQGTTASYTFAATKNVHGVLDVSATNWGTGSADLKIYLPNGNLGLSCPITTTSVLCPFLPKVSGTWKVVIDPVDDSVGTVTMTLASDQTKGSLTPGTPVTTTFGSRGWQTSYTFTSTARLHTSIDVTASNWGGGSGSLDIFEPNGILDVICPLTSAPTFCDFTPPTAGTWRVAVVPTGDSIGSVTMNLAPDQNKGTLTPGTPVTTTLTAKGQRVLYTFTGTNGKKNMIKVSAANWGAGGSANLDIVLPNGQVGVRCPIGSAPTTCSFSPHTSGTWQAVIVPIGNSLGSTTFTLS